jgi:penicillin-binding protein 1A
VRESPPWKRFRWGLPLFLSLGIGAFAFLSGLGFVVTRVTKNLPKIIRIEDYHPKIISRIIATHDQKQTELAQYYKEKRILIPFESIPKHVVDAFLAAEDDKFFEHPGINWVSIIRAVGANLRAGHVVQGGSTITQQVTKSLLLTPERSLDRKLKEVFLAYALERNLKKTQILYLYLNQIYLGHGAWGIEAAAQTYFRKSTPQLSIEEAALLAGMPQAPGKYSPFLNAKRAKERQLYVLRRMMENKSITAEMQKKAGATPLAIFRDKPHRIAPDWTEYLRRFALEHYGEKALYEEGLTIEVEANPHLARYGHDALRTGLLLLDKRMGYRGPQKTLRDPREIEKWIQTARTKLLEYHLDAVILTPDGVMSTDAAIRALGKHHLADLLDEREIYPALVTYVERDRAKIDLGGIHGELRAEDTVWARPVKEDAYLKRPRWKSTKPQDLFQRGDLIMVRPHRTPTGPYFTLDQVPEVEGALISFNLKSGMLVSMAGGFDFTRSEFNRATQAMRQPGSAFKPLIYSAALEKGFTPASILVDSPIVFKDTSQANAWKPNNYEEKFYGDTTFRQALIKSRNVPTIKIVQAIQVPYLIDYAKRLGVAGTFPHDLSLALGSGSMSVLELTKAFALFPRLGKKLLPKWFEKVTSRDGRLLEQLKTKRSAALGLSQT